VGGPAGSSNGVCGPLSTAGCATDGTGLTFNFDCFSPADCECPRQCAMYPDLGYGLCLLPCTDSNQCAQIGLGAVGGSPPEENWCINGFCRPVSCGLLPDGGRNGEPGRSCAAAGEVGTCFGIDGEGECLRAGISTDSCDNGAQSWDASKQCVAGSLCLPAVPPAAGVCVSLCDPDAGTAACPTGFGCDPIFSDLGDTSFGECVPLGNAGCNASGRGATASSCDTSAHCACPFVCHDFGDGGQICAAPCQTTADCDDPSTSCQGGFCLVNGCTTPRSLCDAGGANDGVCADLPFPATGLRCVQGGTASQSCDPHGTRGTPSALCAPPLRCDAVADGGSCRVICDQGSTTLTCPSSDVCFPLGNGAGSACVACVDVQRFCTDASQCCQGSCDLDFFVCL
jgi:hypothetical protein